MRIITGIRNRFIQLVARSGEPLGSGDSLELISDTGLSRIQNFFPRKKYFVLGHPRSGTTILGRLLRLHPEVHCNWNARFFNWDGLVARVNTTALTTWLNGKGNRWVYENINSTELIRVLCDFIMEQEADIVGKNIVGDKTPNLEGALAVDWLHRVYPDARLIIIVRDGRDAVLSMRIRAFIDYPETLSTEDQALVQRIRQNNEPYLSGERSIFSKSWLSKQASLWAENVQKSIALSEELFNHSHIVIRYENLLGDPIATMRRVWNFLGVERIDPTLHEAICKEMEHNPKADWHDERDPGLVQGLRRGTQGGWKDIFTIDDCATFNHAAGEILAAMGYEPG